MGTQTQNQHPTTSSPTSAVPSPVQYKNRRASPNPHQSHPRIPVCLGDGSGTADDGAPLGFPRIGSQRLRVEFLQDLFQEGREAFYCLDPMKEPPIPLMLGLVTKADASTSSTVSKPGRDLKKRWTGILKFV
ncbi:hypothetical protein OPV22_004329 [Ensete ventricosum]|uniref:Uncharacterized protein n=1 Tax=Ensete ventricosum TaxID=4639 RepID=A0AAV8S3F5_ENSVE|nr:hypothetical protein OPV22_004329 [Ensete ventricosum]